MPGGTLFVTQHWRTESEEIVRFGVGSPPATCLQSLPMHLVLLYLGVGTQEGVLEGHGTGACSLVDPFRKNGVSACHGNPGERPYIGEGAEVCTETSHRDLDLKSLEELDAAGVHV